MSHSFKSSNDAIDEGIPLLITLSAHALSSIGFGLSLIAISIEWLLADSPLQDPITNRSQLQCRSCSKAYNRLSLPPNYGSSIPRESRRRQTKRVTFASITVDSKSQEHEQTVSYISERVDHDHDAASLASVSTSILTVSSIASQPGADEEDSIIAPSLMSFREELPSPTTPRPYEHVKATSIEGDLLPGHARTEKSPERKLTWPCRPKLVTHEPRSTSPVERVSRRLAELRLASAPRGLPKPKRAHTVPIPLFKGRNRQPVPRTLPYEAPYFAMPPDGRPYIRPRHARPVNHEQ